MAIHKKSLIPGRVISEYKKNIKVKLSMVLYKCTFVHCTVYSPITKKVSLKYYWVWDIIKPYEYQSTTWYQLQWDPQQMQSLESKG